LGPSWALVGLHPLGLGWAPPLGQGNLPGGNLFRGTPPLGKAFIFTVKWTVKLTAKDSN